MTLMPGSAFDGRLTRHFAAMDIRDLIKPSQSSATKSLLHSSQRYGSHPFSDEMMRSSSFSLPALAATFPIASSSSDPARYIQSAHTEPPATGMHCPHHGQSSQLQSTHHPALRQGFQYLHQANDYGQNVQSRKRSSPDDGDDGRPKKMTKWNDEENKRVIALRGKGMKWGDISQRFPGRTATACRLHYQNYLEKRADWDEEKKNKLARVYERLKEDMWNKAAFELGIPWRAAEAMHWMIGEQEMARRANVTPFSSSMQQPPLVPAQFSPTSTGGDCDNRGHVKAHHLEEVNTFEPQDLATYRGNSRSNQTSGPVSTFTGINALKGNLDLGKAHTNRSSHGVKAERDQYDTGGLTMSLHSYQGLLDRREDGMLLPSVAELESGKPFYPTARSVDGGMSVHRQASQTSIGSRTSEDAEEELGRRASRRTL